MRLTLKSGLTKCPWDKRIPHQAPSHWLTTQEANQVAIEAEAIMCQTLWRRPFLARQNRCKRARWVQPPRHRPTQSGSKEMLIWATTQLDIPVLGATVTLHLLNHTKLWQISQETNCKISQLRDLSYNFAHKSSVMTAMQRSPFVQPPKQ